MFRWPAAAMGLSARLIQLQSRQRAVRGNKIRRSLFNRSNGLLRDQHREGKEFLLGGPCTIMARAFFDDLNLRTGAFHQFFGFKSDVLIPQVAGNLIGYTSWFPFKVSGQGS